MLSQIPIDLSKVKKENLNKEILRAGLIAELDAINLYEQLAALADDDIIKEVILDIAREEKTHVGEFQTLLLREDSEQVEELENGKKEVEEEMKQVIYKLCFFIDLLELILDQNTININEKVLHAKGFTLKLFGLIFKRLKDDEIFLIENCNSVHTFWMRYKIDVIFLDRNNKVVRIYKSLKPFRITPFIKDAVTALEANDNFVNKYNLKLGFKILFDTQK